MPNGCCMGRSRRRQISKWEYESTFRASSVGKEKLSICMSLWHSMYVFRNYQIVIPHQFSAKLV